MLEVSNLNAFYGNIHVLWDISFTVKEAEIFALIGANGSGKSTLLRHMNGLFIPTEGDVWVNSLNTRDSRNIRNIRSSVGMVFQSPDAQIVATVVEEEVAFGPENLRLEHIEIKKRVNRTLRVVGLQDLADQRPHLLSGGEKRRLAIAGVLAMEPRVMVFDEPFASLDYPGVKQVLQQILDLHRSGHTIVVTTHDLEKIIAHTDRLVIMQGGKIVRDGSPLEIVGHLEAFGVREPCAYRLGVEADSWLN